MLLWVQKPEETEATRTEYTYDSMYRIVAAEATTDTNLSLSARYTYTNDLLTAIQTPSTTYSISYGNFGLRTGVSIGSRDLATYTYTENNNYLEKLEKVVSEMGYYAAPKSLSCERVRSAACCNEEL